MTTTAVQRDTMERMNSDEPALPCADKMAFDTPEAAQATGTVSEWRYGGNLKVYKCRYCHLYHLSSNYDD